MRRQLRCAVTVRMRWSSGEVTFLCAEDDATARTVAEATARVLAHAAATNGLPPARLVGVDVSPTGGRANDWRTL